MKTKTNKSKKRSKSAIFRIKHVIKMTFVPHKKNNYRPHLISRYGLIAIFFIVIGLQLGYNGAKTGNVLGRQSDITITTLFNQTNLARGESKIPNLVLNDSLNRAAYMKAKDMFEDQYWAHNAPDGTEPWKWFADVDYNYNEAGENLAKNFTSTSAVMTAWLNSPEHRANILKADYQDVGFAVASGEIDSKPTTLIVALYGTPADSAVAGVNMKFSGPSPQNNASIFTQFAIAIQSITPAVVLGLTLIAIAILVSAFAHTYRRKLPKSLRQSWYRHHGLYKATGLLALGFVMIFVYGVGQI